ncbi:MAG TPA: heavy metal-associated domain-containing protein [Polyangiaceae bacterium]|nr:heavy metal-associated domain-containing protein [Polyangiaceae bacterium]
MRYAIALALFALSVGACASRGPYADTPVAERSSCTVDLAVPTMSCSAVCPGRVRQALASVRGVQEVSVDFEHRSAEVTAEYPACSGDGYDEMLENLHDAGYDGQIVSSY